MCDENNVDLNLDKDMNQASSGTKTCSFCGAVISDKYDVCPVCGTIISSKYSDAKAEYDKVLQDDKLKSDAHDLAIASMCCGIASLLFCWSLLFGIGFAIAGIVLACESKKKGDVSGFRTAGLVTSIISIVLTVLLILFVIYMFVLILWAVPY